MQRALAAEGVAFRDLAPQTARDYFDGELVVLAGYYDADALGVACGQVDGRAVACVLPQTERPDRDVVGRHVVAAMMLMAVDPPASFNSGEIEHE